MTRVFSVPQSLSVIIPTLNEGPHAAACVECIRAQGMPVEIIAVDGGSSDGTPEILRSMEGLRVLDSQAGRGIQIRTGVAAASGDIVLVLHADSRLEPGALSRLWDSLSRRHDVVGGAFELRYDNPKLRFRLVAALNNFRARAFGISFGDQAQFFRRGALRDGFPAMRLMEDVELSMRLKAAGATVFLPRGVVQSSRRWQRHGCLRNGAKVVWLTSRYLILRRLGFSAGDGTWYYIRYY